LITSEKDIALVSHEFTDGDDLGAMLSVIEMLRELGIAATPIARGGVPDNLIFLPGSHSVLDSPPKKEFCLIVFFGCGQFSRPGFPDWNVSKSKILNIDHHKSNELFGDVNLVDEKASAVCELVYELFLQMNAKITKSMAINLLTGIFTDTGGFRHANTSSRVLEIAADLVRKGARIDRIAEHSFGKSNVSKLHAWGMALDNIKFDSEKKMIYTIVTEEELEKLGATPDDLDGIASILSTVPEAKFAMLLRQRGDEVRGSLRSEQYHGIDVSEIARSYGGGGHKLAAGFKFKGKLEHLPQGWKIT